MVETTVDLEEAKSGHYVIKPDFDDKLLGMIPLFYLFIYFFFRDFIFKKTLFEKTSILKTRNITFWYWS